MNGSASRAIDPIVHRRFAARGRVRRCIVRGSARGTAVTALAILPLLLSFGTPCTGETTARSLRCRNDLVSLDDDRTAVQAKCGEPAMREQVCERALPDRYGRIAPCLAVERWTYRPGYGQFVTTLRFEEGALVEIRYGERVP